MIGRTLSHYAVSKSLGAGGMGEVYLARDTKLDRSVALKILPAALAVDRERMRRFVVEAKAASAVSHPNVAHIYEIGEADGLHFIAMEYVAGVTLAERLRGGALPPAEIARIASEIAAALEEAHEHGVIHRDLKPSNIMLTPRGQVKVLDFGLAKMVAAADAETVTHLASSPQTELGTVVGTLPYMSPEQLRASPLDARTDFYSLGVILYQLATGKLPFTGNTSVVIADAILHQDCPSVRKVNPQIPAALSAVISKLTAKDPAERYQSGGEIARALRPLLDSGRPAGSWARPLRRWPVAAGAALVIASLVALGVWRSQRGAKVRWARETALTQALELADKARHSEAFALAVEAERYVPDDPILGRLWPNISRTFTIESEPAGAEVFFKPYRDVEADWRPVGRTPIANLRTARDIFRVKLSKPGFATVVRVSPSLPYLDQVELAVRLDPESEAPAGMVRVAAGSEPWMTIPVDEFWLDRYEVSNREYKRFLDAGGYREPKHWRHRFIDGGRELSWEQAMASFQDTTGRPGPAGWELGNYPEGADELPVTGVSWYEAAAYAEFAGKTLPTVTHWRYAAGIGIGFEIIPLSNYRGAGPHPTGNEASLSPHGSFDMAGNVKEWCWNETAGGERYLCGGAWNDPEYLFSETERRPPLQRERTFGFRCAKHVSPPDPELLAPFDRVWPDFRRKEPFPDDVFTLVKGLYSYEKEDLQAKVEAADDTDRYWRKEKVTFAAAYGDERMIAHLFLPKSSKPPYQAVVFFPGTWAQWRERSATIDQDIDFSAYLDFVVKSGRAAVYPVYSGTFERGGGPPRERSPAEFRDWTLRYIKDLRRTLDYLETRPDLNREKIAFYGYSWGARIGSIAGAVEDRWRVLILAHGGLSSSPRPPEVDEFNFLPRVQAPTIMINGRHDHIFPVELSQQPFFERLGTPPEDKVHLILEGGHSSPRNELIKAVLGWLDRYFGPAA